MRLFHLFGFSVGESATLENSCIQITLEMYYNVVPHLQAPYNGNLAYLEITMFGTI